MLTCPPLQSGPQYQELLLSHKCCLNLKGRRAKDVASPVCQELMVVMKRVAVTGSSGFLGQCLIRHLRKKYPNIKVTRWQSVCCANNFWICPSPQKIMGVDVVAVDSGGAAPDIFVKKDIRNKGLSVQVPLSLHSRFCCIC